ncbi:hypothetical protein Patl1_00579 [Pistacia atlantica]|uniref:Uncharacterized protein n=1 Tax=Pistacia atlantica TaxID=434234 RepID=A0ACC1CAA9_9ROSI|nr:hypothetical protein Patl1_00579 [Pistacia atlantica]
MEKTMDTEQNTLMSELIQGKELTKQLSNPSSSPKTRQLLIQKILSTYEKALSVLNSGASPVDRKLNNNITILASPYSFPKCSPTNEALDQDCKDQCHSKDVYKKRKTMARWTEQVKVCSGTGLEGPLDDGYCWRKYGQKDILGASYPRGYYRCTHRHAQGCLATKLVQRSDDDPTIFEVTYRGRHTCSQNTRLAISSALSTKEGAKDKQSRYHHQQEPEDKVKQSKEFMIHFGTELKVKTEDLDNKEEIFPSFSFPQTSITETENMEHDIFKDSMMEMENNFMGSFSPSFLSPTTSESNYFSVSPCHMNNSFGLDQTVRTPESGITEIISTPNSVTNSPTVDLDFSLIKVDFDPNFPDNLDYFS